MTAQDSWTFDALIGPQRRTRGLRKQTLRGYERLVRLFVRTALGNDPIDPTQFSPSDVIEFLTLLRDRYSPRRRERGGRIGRSTPLGKSRK